MSVTPAGLLISAIAERPLETVERGCCGWMSGDRFLQSSQVISAILVVGSLAAMIMMSLNIAPMSGGTYAFCGVIVLIGAQNAWALQKVKELGGYELQTARQAQQNDLMTRQIEVLSGEVDRLSPLVARFEASAKALEDELGGFRGQNTRLTESVGALSSENRRLEELLSQQERLLREGQEEVKRLQETANTLDDVAKRFRISTDIAKTYFEAERELQAKQAEIAHQLEDIARREEGLLEHLSRDVTRLEMIIKEKQKRCTTLAKRVLPLSLQVTRLSNMINFVQARSVDLFLAAKEEAKRVRVEQFSKLRGA